MNRIQLNAIQQRFWMDNLLKYPTIEYNGTNCTFQVKGELDISILKEAYKFIMLEYPPFHSTVQVMDGIPYFVWSDDWDYLPFQLVEEKEGISEERINELLEALVYQPFDLEKEYPCRFYLIRGQNCYYLLHSIHHIAIDGISIQTFFRRLSLIYNDLLNKTYTSVEQLPMLNQFNWDLGQSLSRQKEQDRVYWKDYIQNIPLGLPVPRQAVKTNTLKENDFCYDFTLGSTLYENLHKFCVEQKTSPFRVYSTVWALALSRLLHEKELLIDHTVNLRGKEYHDLFGVFVNDLPIRYNFCNGETSFIEQIVFANENRHKEREHLYAFYDDILSFRSGENLDKRDMINASINYPLDFGELKLDLNNCITKNYRHVNVIPPLDLVLAISSDALQCNIRFKPSIPRTFVQSLAETFREILSQVLAHPDIKLKDIRLLPVDKEQALLERENNALHNKVIAPQTFIGQFRKSVSCYPGHIAVEYGDLSFTYAELDKQSTLVAKALQRMRLHNQYIGLSIPKNPLMIVGILGILKSGNVYVPVDYEYPVDRIAFMLDDCKISALLVTKETPIFSHKVPLLSVEDLVQEDEHDTVLPQVSPSDTAYVIYTSGTTGKPKGIPIKHVMLAQTVVTAMDVLQLHEHSRELQFANICFDASVMEIFPALAAGATLVLSPEQERKDPVAFVDFLEKCQITSMFIPPAFLATIPHRHLPKLHTIFVGGDSCSQEVINYWSENRLFVNVYGPTENCVDATHAILTPESQFNDIGLSVPGSTCYVLDEYMQLMPDYTMGELYIGGLKLTDGYLNRPELNVGKFLANPFASKEKKKDDSNLRLYKSGDLVMRRADGHLIFIGRSDYQIKLNGYRIELGDIESQIMQFGDVIKNAVVLVHEQEGRKSLVAYVLVVSVKEFSTGALKSYLMQHLPAYMVPAAIVPMENFPYNTSGKVERKLLPAPFLHQENRKVELPETDTEKRLAVVWSGLLSEQIIGREDSFIALGGDSMAVIQLSFHIQEQFGCRITASEIYQHILLKELAVFIEQRLEVSSEKNKTNVIPVQEKVALSPSQFSLWMECTKTNELKDAYNLPCLFECPSTLEPLVFEQAFNDLIETQDGFRMYFPIDQKGQPFIQVAQYTPVHVEVYDILEAELSECLTADMKISFDLTQPFLFHCKLYRVDGKKYVCSLVMHHLISDGWSAHLIQSVLVDWVSGRKERLEKMSGSYVEYSLKANQFIHTGKYADRVRFWEKYMVGITELKLPQHEQGSGLAGRLYTCGIPEELSEKIYSFCRTNGYTQFIFYYAVYMMVLSRVYKQTNFAVGFPYLGREQNDEKWIIGYFIQVLLLCYKKEYGQSTFLDYLTALKNSLIAVEEQAISYDKIVEIARACAAEPNLELIKVMFTFEEKALYHDYLLQDKAVFDMVFSILSDKDDRIYCRIGYRNSNFTEEEIELFAAIYQTVLRAVVENPDKSLLDYPLASPAYSQAIIQQNALAGKLSHSKTFLEQLAWNVQNYSQQIALIDEKGSMTYKEMDELSDAVAVSIRKAGVGSSAIALLMSASNECIVTMLGILKAGCCFVPLDVELPEERRKFILQDAGCVMLFDRTNYPFGEVIDENIVSHKKDALPGVAYIIYTSGTTGMPKGVPISCQALDILSEVGTRVYGLSKKSRGLLFASISFDASVLEIFPVLFAGAALVIASASQRKDPVLLANLMEEQALSFVIIPPAILPLLPKRKFPSLETIVVGGETTALSALEYWHKDYRLINAYGPTENTVDTTLCVVDDDFEPNDIGIPLPGVSCYVLDEYYHIVPDNVIGELYIGGMKLTSGYLNRSELNKEKFIENPYAVPEDKALGINTFLYKSGDLVKRRSDGHFIFMGRADNQVKLRGFRIELSDIETQLQQCGNVQNALVEVWKKDNREELVAFVQPCASALLDISDLQTALRGKLPAYMIPSKWAVVDEFPLTINGKIDRKRLPEPDVVVKREVVGADTEDEKALLAIAEEVIGTEGIGVETDLLDEAGMTSMQVMEFVGKVITGTSLRITVSSVYKCRTIRRLLHDVESGGYFWFTEYDARKPVLVFITGFPAVSPFYDGLLRFFAEDFSVFVFDSYYDFFIGKESVSLDVLLQFYAKILLEVLEGKPIAMLTGYCTGAELAIALADYMQREHPEKALYPVLNMEAVYQRVETDEIPEEIIEEILRERIRITNELYKNFPALDYNGSIVHVMAANASKMIYLERGEENDERLLEQMRQMLGMNHQAWKEHYPNAPYYELDCDHWTFFEEKNLSALRKIIRKHWNI